MAARCELDGELMGRIEGMTTSEAIIGAVGCIEQMVCRPITGGVSAGESLGGLGMGAGKDSSLFLLSMTVIRHSGMSRP